MKRSSRFAILIIGATVLITVASCHRQTRNRLDEIQFPRIVIWAWERPEDLSFIDSHKYGIAFLAQTLTLKNDDVVSNPRHQPLEVPPDTKMMAVTRIESQKVTGQKPALSASQREKLVKLIRQTLERGRVTAIQVDFDALVSERDFYRALLQDLRAQLPDNVPLSMTALASFCIGDRWLNDLPVDDAVPMIFRMGADDRSVRNMLANGNDFGEPLCRRSYGIALDEPLQIKFDESRRVYVFNNHAWRKDDLVSLKQRM
ncbi:MAG TPA: hypothetical protein VE863_16060 [Pyrinomonadaceae bacterium]|jgi:hypothetical protein|nr:hypothetical protein [Pyrinomonadaceae bacterium]